MHKTETAHSRRSLRRNLIFWVLLCVLPILIILFLFAGLITRSFEGQMRTYAQQMVSPFAAEIDALLASSLRYIGSQDLNLSSMDPGRSHTELERMNEMQELGDTISESLSIYTDIDAVFLYHASRLWFVHNTNRSYAKNQQAANFLESQFSESASREHLLGEGWRAFHAGDTCYLYLCSEMTEGVIGCWFEEDYLLQSIEEKALPGFLAASLSDVDGKPLCPDSVSSSWENSFFSTQTALSEAPFSLTVYWDEAVLFSSFRALTIAAAVCLCLASFLFILCLFALRRSFILPLDRLITRIRGLRKNDFAKLSLEQAAPQEVQEVVSALNIMVDEVKDLKIQVYEEQLKKQQTQMQLYQLQLRPHFLLNMLNNLISYAQINDLRSVKTLAMFLSSHCRYILYNTWFVTVEEELEYTRNYFEMQTMHNRSNRRYIAEYNDDVLDLEIPILCIQIFVENSLKCAAAADPLEIRVSAFLAEKDHLHLVINDNGPGFSSETLKSLEASPAAPRPGDGHGIGIFNVRERLQILYGDNAAARFSNSGSGARVELFIPTDGKRRKI